MIAIRRFLVGLVASAGLAWGACGQAAMFVYELPDGSRIVTTRSLTGSHYKLVLASAHLKDVGIVAASRNPQFMRADPDNYDRLIARMADRHGLEPALLKAVMHAESAFNPYATSHKGASGLMQLMPGTAARFGVTDIYDPEQNIRAGAEYLRFLLKRFNNKYPLAIAAYNAGEGSVDRYQGIPPYGETRRYVKKVLHLKRRYAALFNGEA